VALHNGTITAYSEGVGKGSEFIVRLPLAGAAIADEAPTKERVEGDPESRRILLADDNVDFANSLAALLSAKGHDVRVARDGAEALRTAADFNPDFAFLDIGMPKVHGYEVARRLRSDPGTADCVLVAVTGWGQEDDRQRAREAGFDRHLVKPVNAGDIETILKGE
jgi:CheY-like chemotaxis protein